MKWKRKYITRTWRVHQWGTWRNYILLAFKLFNRIIYSNEIQEFHKQASRTSKIQTFRERKIRDLMIYYAESIIHSFTWKDFKEHLIETSGIILDIPIIRRILKERMNYSYKRWSPRPQLVDRSIWKIKKILFADKLLKIMNKSTILINIDESAISDSTKANYS